MDKTEFRAAQATLELDQPEMAQFLKCSRRTVNGMANGSAPIHPSTSRLLRLMVLWQLKPADLPG